MKVLIAEGMPWPPTVNHMYHDSGPRYLTKEARAYYKEVWACLMESKCRPRPFTGPVEMTVNLYPPDHRKRDADNTMKAIQDGLTKSKLVWGDDVQVKKLHIYRHEPQKPGRVDISITTAEKEEPCRD